MKEVREILVIEMKRLREKTEMGILSPEDLKRLESLTRSWKNYFGNEIDETKDTLDGVSKEDLLKILEDGTED